MRSANYDELNRPTRANSDCRLRRAVQKAHGDRALRLVARELRVNVNLVRILVCRLIDSMLDRVRAP